MSIIIGADGCFEVGPPPEDDPVRQAHARILRSLAFEWEQNLQQMDAHCDGIEELKRRVTELERAVSLLEGLLIGEAA